MYSNDESDKSIRKRNYLATVYLLPVAVVLIICSTVYFYSTTNEISRVDATMGYALSISFGVIIFAYNKNNWLKMPDGTFYNIKGVTPPHKIYLSEPAEYEAEFGYSKAQNAGLVILGVILIGMAAYFGVKGIKSIIVPIYVLGIGGMLLFKSITGMLDKAPVLKLAKSGLWTKKLGYVEWKDITKAQVVEERSGRSNQMILKIYLKGTIFAEAGEPDQRLLLTTVAGKENVEILIDDLVSKYNGSVQ